MSKYLSKAKEKINREKIAISNDGIKVKRANEIIYFTCTPMFIFNIQPHDKNNGF